MSRVQLCPERLRHRPGRRVLHHAVWRRAREAPVRVRRETSLSPSPPLKLVLLENPGRGGSLRTTSASRSAAAGQSMPSTPGSPGPGSLRWMIGALPAATPGRTSSGSRAPRTVSVGRSTPSSRTARPPVMKATERRPVPAAPDRRRRDPDDPRASMPQDGGLPWPGLRMVRSRTGVAVVDVLQPDDPGILDVMQIGQAPGRAGHGTRPGTQPTPARARTPGTAPAPGAAAFA